jgi:hypothetical protein
VSSFVPAVLAFLFCFPGIAEGQNNGVAELITDRPDFTESGVVVPLGSFQFEGGLMNVGEQRR